MTAPLVPTVPYRPRQSRIETRPKAPRTEEPGCVCFFLSCPHSVNWSTYLAFLARAVAEMDSLVFPWVHCRQLAWAEGAGSWELVYKVVRCGETVLNAAPPPPRDSNFKGWHLHNYIHVLHRSGQGFKILCHLHTGLVHCHYSQVLGKTDTHHGYQYIYANLSKVLATAWV